MDNDCGLKRYVTVLANPAEPAWTASANIMHYSIALLLILSILIASWLLKVDELFIKRILYLLIALNNFTINLQIV